MTASLSLPLLPPSILAPVLRVHLVARRAVASSIYHSIHPSLISSPPPLPLLTPVLRVHADARRADYLPDSIKVMVWCCILQIMASIAAQRRLASVNCHLSYVTCNLSRVRMCARTASQKGFSPLPSACLPPRLLAAASPPTRLAASSRPWRRILFAPCLCFSSQCMCIQYSSAVLHDPQSACTQLFSVYGYLVVFDCAFIVDSMPIAWQVLCAQ